ncbi:MAG TPA: hypothetical protein DDX92_06350 [Flavobacteriales bacterium]|jgi:hypothetical protein|nr:hypothetical protein [Flavobacteriales bacterium]
METYDNAYKKEEDELLWEIHEIRNDIHSSKSYDDLNSLNKKSIEIFNSWKSRDPQLVENK